MCGVNLGQCVTERSLQGAFLSAVGQSPELTPSPPGVTAVVLRLGCGSNNQERSGQQKKKVCTRAKEREMGGGKRAVIQSFSLDNRSR